MKISVLVIAHNEELHIKECLSSLRKQSVVPDEIVLVAHNCTDETIEIARRFPEVNIEVLTTSQIGPIYARIRGFEIVRHEIVACLDGDCVASRDWLRNVTKPLGNPGVAGTWGLVLFKNSLSANIAALWFFYVWKLSPWHHFYFWGANFACKKSAYSKVGGLRSVLALRSRLWLAYAAEDCCLSLALEEQGSIMFAKNAVVHTYEKDQPKGNYLLRRGIDQSNDKRKIFSYYEV